MSDELERRVKELEDTINQWKANSERAHLARFVLEDGNRRSGLVLLALIAAVVVAAVAIHGGLL